MELTRTAGPQINFAVVDLGSNTIRMTLYDVQEQGGFQALFSEKRMAGLVNYIRSGSLTREGIEVACSVLRGFQRLLAQFGPVPVHVFATASLRNIRNTKEVLAAIRENTGLEVEVLSGELEARYGCIGAMLTCPLAGGAVFDIGGGSTEIVRLENGKIVSAQSLDIGSLNLYNRYVSELWPSRPEIDELTSAVRKKLRKADLPKKPSPFICGIGGTARAVLKIANQYLEKPESNRLLTVAELDRTAAMLLDRKNTARKLILKNCPDRVHTILPGVIVMTTVTHKLCKEQLYISRYGVREGYLCQKLIKPGI